MYRNATGHHSRWHTIADVTANREDAGIIWAIPYHAKRFTLRSMHISINGCAEVSMSNDSDDVEDIRALAERYRLLVQRSNWWHYDAAKRADARSRILGISSAALGAIVGTSIFATVQSSPSVDWRITAGILITAAALLGALQTFLDYAGRATEYRTAAAAYGRLRREFDMFLLKISTSRDRAQLMEDLSVLCRHIDYLTQSISQSADDF